MSSRIVDSMMRPLSRAAFGRKRRPLVPKFAHILVPCYSPCGMPTPLAPVWDLHVYSTVAVTVGKDAGSDPEYLLEKLGGFDFASIGSDGPGEKGLEALSGLKQALAKVCLQKKKTPLLPHQRSAGLLCTLLLLCILNFPTEGRSSGGFVSEAWLPHTLLASTAYK